MVVVMWAEFASFASGLANAVPLSAAFVGASFAIGWVAGAAQGADRRARFTLAAEFSTRNVAVATAIAVTLLHRVDFAVFATTYLLVELPLLLGAAWLFRRAAPTSSWLSPRAGSSK